MSLAKKQTALLEAVTMKISVAIDFCVYFFNCPLNSYLVGVKAVISDPEQELQGWVQKRNEENSFIGLAGSVISATTAQLLGNDRMLRDAPWTASAAYIVSLCLSIMAVVMALHQTVFLNSIEFLPKAERIGAIFGVQQSQEPEAASLKRCARRGACMYSLPQFVLTYSIFALFVGIGLTTMSALWNREFEGAWNGSQKIAATAIVAIVFATGMFAASIAYQWSAARLRQQEIRPADLA